MDKRTLLDLIKEENQCVGDPYETEVEAKSWHISALCAGLFGMLLFFLEWFVWGEYSVVAIAPITVMLAIAYTVQAVRFKTAKKIVMAVFFDLLFAFLVVCLVLVYGFGWR